jgi:hypothetical protein
MLGLTIVCGQLLFGVRARFSKAVTLYNSVSDCLLMIFISARKWFLKVPCRLGMGADILLIDISSVREWFLNFPSRKQTGVAILWYNERVIIHGFRNMKFKKDDCVLIQLQKRQINQYEIKTPKAFLLPIVTNRWNGFCKDGRASTRVVIKAYFNVSRKCSSSDFQRL